MRLKRYKKKNIGYYIYISLLIVTISLLVALFVINDFSKKANLILFPMAESKTRKVVTMIINSACDDVVISDDLYVVNKNNNDMINFISYNSFKVNKLINEVTLNVEEKLRDFEEGKINYYGEYDDINGGVIAEIPFFVIYGDSLLSNIGPKIRFRLEILGDITSNIETEVKPYGINNAYVEMRISLEVTARIVLPFVSEKVIISNVIPISMNIVQGTVPDGFVYSYK